MNNGHELIDAYLDEELTPDGERRLAEWLAADRKHIREFVRETQLHRQIREAMLARQFQADAFKALEEADSRLKGSPLRPFAGRLTRLSNAVRIRFANGGRRIVGAHSRFSAVRFFSTGHRRGDAFQGKRIWPGPKPALALAASVALLIGLAVWLFPPVSSEPTLALTPGAQVTIQRGTEEFPASEAVRLQPGDTLVVVGTNSVALQYGAELTQISISGGTKLKLASFGSGKRFGLLLGKVEASVARQRPFRPLVMSTPEAEARVLGTRFSLTAATNATRLEVMEGSVKLTRKSDDASVKVGAGQYAVAATNYELAAQPLTGGISREYWTNLAGDNLAFLITHPNYPDQPDGGSHLTNHASLEMPSNWADNYGVRLRGYIHTPETGDYTFWIAARDDASLWLSPDEDPDNKVHMAHSDAVGSQDWQSDAIQQSASVPFTAGRRYYFEVLHKAGVGDDHLAVAWRRPGGVREVIPGEYLSPFKAKFKQTEKKR